ncbi:MAG: lytic murein transglycosylase B [Pseudomonadales bacterium]
MKTYVLPFIGVFLLNLFPAFGFANGEYATRSDVRDFARELAAEHREFSVEEILSAFESATYKQNIIDAISRPAEKTLQWDEYQDIFLTARRISGGKNFMSKYETELEAARERFGVPPEIVAAIIGVETMYGSNRGSFKVLDALTTLAFDYPPRSAFFKSELRHFFLLAREEKQQVTEVLGSYAGAMGYGQFIPSSYRHYAVDFDNDGVRDIWNNPVDAIGSVANYLSEHGWEANQPVALRVTAPPEVNDKVFTDAYKPSMTLGDVTDHGVKVGAGLARETKVAAMSFKGKSGDEYWLGMKNFYVITRYNHSKLYAMAVYQLSQSLRSEPLVISVD